MKKTLAVASLVIVGSAFAADTFVGAYQLVPKNVADAPVIHTDRLGIAPDGTLYKSGARPLVIQDGALAQQNEAAITVVEGEVRFAPGAGPAAETPSVLADAAFWLKADDVDAHFEKEGDAVSTWYDARETDVASRQYICVKALDNAGAAVTTTLTEKDGFKSVYFGGLGSGKAMRIFLPGAASATKITTYHLFAVVGHYQKQGHVFGSGDGGGSMFMFNPSGNLGSCYADPQYHWPSVSRNNTYVDGERFDPYADITPSGRFHLFDHGGQISGSTGALFGQWSAAQYWGGDYLAEAIAFTNVISETERLQIADYLTRKYFPSAKPVKRINAIGNGTYALDASDEAVRSADVVLAGDGTLVKRGDNAAFFRSPVPLPTKDDLFRGTVQLAEGSLELSTEVALAVAAGDSVSATKTDGGNRALAVAATAGDGKLEKTGDEFVTIAAVPDGVTEVDVKGGELVVRPAAPAKPASKVSYFVPIENPSFEDYFTDEEWLDPERAGAYGIPAESTAKYTKGWRRQTNAARLFNWRLWTGNAPVMDKTTRDAWNMVHAPIDGDCAIMLFRNALLATPVTITEPGMYEVSFDIYARESASSYGFYGTAQLIDPTTHEPITVFGRAHYLDHQYRRVAFKARVDQVGTFELAFRAQDENDNLPVVVDNFKLRFVPERELASDAWPVPNGTFEFAPAPAILGAANRDHIRESPFDNWTFDQGEGAGIAALVSQATTNVESNAGVEANGLGAPSDSFRQLLLKADACSATVTFTPPEGLHYLQADVGRYYQYRGQLTATATVAGEDVALGSFVVTNHLMKAYTWPTPFVADGESEVSVTFSFAREQNDSSVKTGVNIDNVRLVPIDDRELLENAGFEKPYGTAIPNWAAGWTRLADETNVVDSINGLNSISFAAVQPYSYLPNIFAGDKIEGDYFLYIERDGGAARNVTFPHAGLYRLSLQAATTQRTYDPAQGWYKGPDGVRTWIAKDGVTNEIGRTGFVTTTNFCQHVWEFRVPEAGTYSFGLRGTRQMYGGGNVVVDALSIRSVAASEHGDLTAPVFAADTKLNISTNARLHVEFDGTNSLKRLTVGGKRLRGVIDVKDYPEYFSGRGAFKVDPVGMTLILQ